MTMTDSAEMFKRGDKVRSKSRHTGHRNPNCEREVIAAYRGALWLVRDAEDMPLTYEAHGFELVPEVFEAGKVYTYIRRYINPNLPLSPDTTRYECVFANDEVAVLKVTTSQGEAPDPYHFCVSQDARPKYPEATA
jgi:hypothetical protein